MPRSSDNRGGGPLSLEDEPAFERDSRHGREDDVEDVLSIDHELGGGPQGRGRIVRSAIDPSELARAAST